MIEMTSIELTIKRQSELLTVKRTSLYYKPVGISAYEIELMHAIDRIFTKWPCFGYRRVTAKLREQGHAVNEKRILRLMKKMGLYAIFPGPNLSKRNQRHHVYPYLLRNLEVTRVNQVWSIDITYIPMKNGFVYLFAIIDWYSRCIIGYELSNSLDTSFVVSCLEKAFRKAKPEIINSDQGCQFTSAKYIELLKSNDIKISMDGRGRATDNARIERFFRSLKYERLYLIEYSSVLEVMKEIKDFIHEYNHERPHQSLGYQHPAKVHGEAC